MDSWEMVEENKQNAIAICSFQQPINELCLKFKLGDRLVIRQETNDWFYGYIVQKPTVLGIFPKNYVQVYDLNALNHP